MNEITKPMTCPDCGETGIHHCKGWNKPAERIKEDPYEWFNYHKIIIDELSKKTKTYKFREKK